MDFSNIFRDLCTPEWIILFHNLLSLVEFKDAIKIYLVKITKKDLRNSYKFVVLRLSYMRGATRKKSAVISEEIYKSDYIKQSRNLNIMWIKISWLI